MFKEHSLELFTTFLLLVLMLTRKRMILMILDVVRHGQSVLNSQKRFAGSTDTPLTEFGEEQARLLAEQIKDEKYDLIVSSNLQRALKTAEILHEGRQEPLVVMPDFAERCLGIFEGLSYDEIEEKGLTEMADQGLKLVDAAPPEAESMRQVSLRVERGLKQIQHQGVAKVLLVCHGFVIKEINRRLNNLSFEEMEDFRAANCELVRFIIADSE